MNDRPPQSRITLSIAAVERDTGLGKDTLRVWERRYGFPSPQRDDLGERAYTLDEVEKLRTVKRLLDAGHRPGRVVPLPLSELRLLADGTADPARRGADGALARSEIDAQLRLILGHDIGALRTELQRLLARAGLARFVTEVVGALNEAVGEAWLRGQLEVFEEHAYTEVMQVVLRQAIAAIPAPATPPSLGVLLTTFPDEPHGLGLLMGEAVFALEGCRCVSLGVQTPPWDIVRAAAAFRADIVALSFTGCTSPRQTFEGLRELRAKLGADIRLWVGGSAPVLRRRHIEGVQTFAAFDDVPAELRRLRQARSAMADTEPHP